MQEKTTEPTILTASQMKRMISDLQSEVTRVEDIKKGSESRARRYNDITSRVNFLKKRPAKVERDLRRLYVANTYVDRCIESLNQLNAQLAQYEQQLKASI